MIIRGTFSGRVVVVLLVSLLPFCVQANHDITAANRLACELAEEGQFAAAALEFRRLALETSDPVERGGWFWAAAQAYTLAGRPDLAPALLERAEDTGGNHKAAVLLARAAAASTAHEHLEAAYYLQSALHELDDPDWLRFAACRAAGEQVRAGQLPAARSLLSSLPSPDEERLAILAAYERGRDKRPLLGGLLGLVPGLGYAYSGEYANALRCLLLNGLFMGAMAWSAAEDQWGAFAIITFFEITWYSGSIYGGVDAAHRHNRDRRQGCLTELEGAASFMPEWRQLPLVVLQFNF